MHRSSGPGIIPRQKDGNQTTTLTSNNLPVHTRTATLKAHEDPGTMADPVGNSLSGSTAGNIDKGGTPGEVIYAGTVTLGNTGNPSRSVTRCLILASVSSLRSMVIIQAMTKTDLQIQLIIMKPGPGEENKTE